MKYHKTHSTFETISVPLCIFCKIQTIELHFLMIFFSLLIFLSTTNNISTIREQTGIRRKRNKFVLFDNHSLISDRFHFLLSNQPQLYSAIHKKYTTFNIFDVFIIGYNNFMEKGKTENEFVYTFRRGV